MPINIFDAADGFLPRARIVAYPTKPMTIDGPRTAMNSTINMIGDKKDMTPEIEKLLDKVYAEFLKILEAEPIAEERAKLKQELE